MSAVVESIKEGLPDIYSIGIDTCNDVPYYTTSLDIMYKLCKAITADIFYRAGIKKYEAKGCFNTISKRILNSRLLWDLTLKCYRGINSL